MPASMFPPRSFAWPLVGLAAFAAAASCEQEPTTIGSGGGTATSASGFAPLPFGSGGCAEAAGGAPPIVCDPLHGSVSFSVDVAPIFSGCAREVCHDAIDRRSVVDVPSSQCAAEVLVVPGHPESSYLLRKLRGDGMCCGERMPPGEPPIGDADFEAIVAWICQDAPE